MLRAANASGKSPLHLWQKYHARVSPQVSGCLTALVDSVLNPPRDDVLRTPTLR
jgi:hypothetical protein